MKRKNNNADANDKDDINIRKSKRIENLYKLGKIHKYNENKDGEQDTDSVNDQKEKKNKERDDDYEDIEELSEDEIDEDEEEDEEDEIEDEEVEKKQSFSDFKKIIKKYTREISKNRFVKEGFIFNLPNNWTSTREHRYNKFNKNLKNNLQGKYELIKEKLLEKNISFKQILELDINETQKTSLVEKYSIMKYYLDEDLLTSFLLARDKLHSEYTRIIKMTDEAKEILSQIEESNNNIESKIYNLNLDEYHKKLILIKYMRMTSMDKHDSDKSKITEWINIVTSIPYSAIAVIPSND